MFDLLAQTGQMKAVRKSNETNFNGENCIRLVQKQSRSNDSFTVSSNYNVIWRNFKFTI